MFPNTAASAFTGLPAKKKKPTHRGRKPSGKPGANHLDLLNKAHSAGDHAMARTHALNYAKATMGSAGPAQPASVADASTAGGPDNDADDVMSNASPSVVSAASTPKPAFNRSALAKVAMGRKRQ